MSGLRVAAVSSFVVLLAIACGGPQAEGPGGRPSASLPLQRVGDACASSSVPSAAACAPRAVPPGDGSSADGCRSDADCKDPHRFDGRCVKNPSYGGLAPLRAAGNLLAAPPPAPPHSVCVYDDCHTDADCAAKSRCVCGSGGSPARNHCTPLDQCRADRDCGADHVCTCAAGGSPNYCVEGDCHRDEDCANGLRCEGSRCHTKNDKCRSQADCPPNSEGGRVCAFAVESRRWECHVVPPVPPG